MAATQSLQSKLALVVGLAVGLISCFVAGVVVWKVDQSSIDTEKSKASIEVVELANAVEVSLERALSATYAVAALVKQGDGQIRDFPSVAKELLPYYPGVQSLQVAPGGVISEIYPLAGNERALGHNLFADPARNKEALRAKESGTLTLAGPFKLLQGGMGAAGRLPVYMPAKRGAKESFWGFSIALMRFPEALDQSALSRLVAHGYHYRLWKNEPNTGNVQVIASSIGGDVQMLDSVEHTLDTPNGTWQFAVTRIQGWRDSDRLVIHAGIGVLLSVMLGWIASQVIALRNSRLHLSRTVEERTFDLSKEIALRKMAQAQASTEALRLATILQTSGDGIHILDPDGLLIEANKAFLEMLGYDSSAIGQLHLADWECLTDWVTIKKRHDQLLEFGASQVFETRHRRSDGATIDVEISAAGIRIDGKSYLCAASRDITSRKRNEAERAELLARLQRISTQVPGVIYQFLLRADGTSCFPYASDALRDIYGVSPAEVAQDASKVFARLHPDDLSEVRNSISASAKDLSRWIKEYRVVSGDGSTRWVSGNATPQRAEDGAVLWHGFITDITEQKKVEQQLVESELRLRALIQAIPDLVWLKNVEGVYLTCNARFEQFFGASSADILGKTDYDFVSREMADAFRANDQAAMDLGSAKSNEEWITFASDGHRELLETTKTPIRDALGNVIGVLGIGHDITERHRSEVSLRESETRFREIFNSVSDAIFIHDAQSGRILDVNHSMCEMYGVSYEKALASGPQDLGFDIPPYSPAEALQKIHLARTEGPQSFDWLARVKGGQPLWTSVSLKVAHIGSRQCILAVVRDVSQRKDAESKLLLAANVFGHAREGITITDGQGIIMDVNEAFTRITGYSRDEVVGKNPSILSSGRQDAAFYRTMWTALNEQGFWTGEIWNRRKDGGVYAEMLTISAVRGPDGEAMQYVALFSDITAMKEHQRELEHLANFDALTGLPNRLLLADRLQQAMAHAQRRGQQLAVAYLDLDGFKNVNDCFGHAVGDELLIAVATAMKGSLREGDTLARIGGDEFVAVLIDLDSVESCVPLLNRLVYAAAQPIQVGSHSLQSSASVGVTFFPQTLEVEADQLLRQADQAMYQAKLAGKNRYHVFDPAQDSSIRGHHEGIEQIRQALSKREFVLYYQPKVNMVSGAVIGVEALIRWQHPQKGLLLPADFLPMVEEHPIAIDIGEWVIASALAQMEAWQSEGLDLTVSVNVGAMQLQHKDFVHVLKSILAKFPSVQPSRLELEVLETSALADMAQVSQVIDECHHIGVKFALDDFGTGYSSLTYLKRLRVELLKIDQSFVRDMLEDPDDLAILRGVIGLATAFRRDVVAEGVETIAHGTALLHLGCVLAQGYGIAKPMTAQQIPAWVASWRPDGAWSALPLPLKS